MMIENFHSRHSVFGAERQIGSRILKIYRIQGGGQKDNFLLTDLHRHLRCSRIQGRGRESVFGVLGLGGIENE